MAITIFLAIAQAEREKTSERIKEVLDNKRKNKEAFFGANSIPFGYAEELDKNGIRRLIKDEVLRDALEEFWHIATKYENVSKAARHVNMMYDLKRTKKLWFDVVKNEIYTGTYRGVEEYCPAHVSKEDWRRLQGRQIKKTQSNRIYLFTGLIRCPECGNTMSATYSKQKRSTGEVKEYKSYRCKNALVGICKNKKTVSEMRVENWLLNNLSNLLKDEISRVEIENSKPKPKPKTNIASLKEQLRKLNIVYMSNNMLDEEYFVEQKLLKDAIAKAEQETPIAFNNRDLTILKETLETNFEELYAMLDLEDKRRFWRSLIKEIKIKGNAPVSVTFN